MTLPSLFSPEDILSMRQAARMRQAELAHALGYDRTVVSNWERGRSPMHPSDYLPFLDAIMARFVLLDYLDAQKYHLYQIAVTHLSHLPLPSAITAL